jgi:hypothetical protein
MNFSPGEAGRNRPFGGPPCGERPVALKVTVLLLICALIHPGLAAARAGGWAQAPWRAFGGVHLKKPRRAPLLAAVPLPRPRPAEAPARSSDKSAVTVATPNEGRSEPSSPPPSACRLALSEEIAIAPSIPDIHGEGGCGGEDLVRLEAVVLPDKNQVSMKPAAILRCAMASAVADWIRTDMVPLAADLGSVIRDLDNADSYDCRGRNRVVGAKLSEHGRANALDVRALRLANGRSISLTDRTVPREIRESVLHSACARFSTVLGPGSDGFHEEHIHLDLIERRNDYRICQWEVWDPLPQIAPLLPAERPEQAPPREVDKTATDRTATEDKRSDALESDQADHGHAAHPTKKRRQSRRF